MAAKVLAKSAIEILANPNIIEKSKVEHKARLGEDFIYTPLLGNREPPLDYRKVN